MRVKEYSLLLNKDREIGLVRERSTNYPEVQNIQNSNQLVDLFNALFAADRLAEEYVWVVALNNKNSVSGVFELSHGGLNASICTPREIFIRLCLCGATSFILVHNHPSGDPVPSSDDNNITLRLKDAADIMNIEMLDHIIIGDGDHFSYRKIGEI